MRLNLGLRSSFIIPLVATLLVGLGILGIYNRISQFSLIRAAEEESLKNNLTLAQSIIGDQLDRYLQMAMLIATIPSVGELASKGDRNRLITEFSPAFDSLRKRFKLAQFHFHRPPAISLVRLHMPDRYGDDISDHRLTVVAVNEKKSAVKGIEVGKGGIGLRGVVPISSKGTHVGSLDFGGDLSPAVDELKRAINVEAGVIISKEALSVWPGLKEAVMIGGDYVSLYTTAPAMTEAFIRPELVAKARKAGGKPFTEQGEYGGKEYGIGLLPLRDYSGKEIGYFYIFRDRSPIASKANRIGMVNYALYIAAIAGAFLLINFSLKKTIIGPIATLTEKSDAVSLGQLSEKIEMTTGDEIATLAKSIDRMRVSMKKLLE